jgi:hypothetical protein
VPKPSDLLLHYNYGAAAIKMWGRGIEVLRDHAKPLRPPPPKQVEMGPSRTTHDRRTAIQKRDAARNATAGPSRTTRRIRERDADEVGGGNAVAGPGIEGIVDSEGQAQWDEDEVMLFCGETQTLQKTDIARNWKRALGIWSSGGKVWLRFQSDPDLISLSQRTFSLHQYNM